MEHLIDAHCHYSDKFAEYSGGVRFICNAAAYDDWETLVALRDDNIYIAIGLHPWHVTSAPSDWAGKLHRMLDAYPHAMVGEIGLDRARGDFDAQCAAFFTQYEMAARLGRPVHIHCVRAWDVMLGVMNKLPAPPAVVMHRFSASPRIVQTLVKMNMPVYFSYRGVLSPRARVVIAETPINRILVETDGAAPDAESLRHTICDIADICRRDATDMANIIYNNTLRMINNGQTA